MYYLSFKMSVWWTVPTWYGRSPPPQRKDWIWSPPHLQLRSCDPPHSRTCTQHLFTYYRTTKTQYSVRYNNKTMDPSPLYKTNTVTVISCVNGGNGDRWTVLLPEDEVFGLLWYRHFWRKGERLSPVHHFPVCLLRRLRAERGITWKQQKHQQSFINTSGLGLVSHSLRWSWFYSVSYLSAFHTWWHPGSTSHTACCIHFAWRLLERCSLGFPLWRRPDREEDGREEVSLKIKHSDRSCGSIQEVNIRKGSRYGIIITRSLWV